MAKTQKGVTGFYRGYNPGKYETLEEAIRATFEKAEELGFCNLRINEQQTGRTGNGGFFVALTGRE